LKLLAAVLVATICASCTSAERASRPAPPTCASLTTLQSSGVYESSQVAFLSDSLQIGALLTKPIGPGPFPAYVHNHGAMTQQNASGPLWSSPGEIDSRLALAGYVVLRPARRGYLGSEGNTTTYWVQGSTLRASDVIYGAYEEAKDVQAAVEYLGRCPFVDGRRIAIGGHSVGGLVTVIAATKRPDVAGVVSINGGITWIQNGVQEGFPAVSAVWRAEAKRLSAPILLLHGRDDAVVTPELSRELAGLLQQRDVQVTFKLYPGGHHSFPIDEIVRFLDENVRGR
jgi:dipeptidyl aminopeptidase/acylaminoacyl peptidase